MNLKTYPLGELQANCYFLVEDKECVIIDPGDSADFILEEISRNTYEVKALIATHGHFDHVMAVGELQTSLNIPFYISSADQFLLDRVEQTAKYFLGHTPEGIFQISNFKFQIFHTPGHTPGSCCIYLPSEQSLFTGDTLFKDGIGRYDFSYSDKKQLFSSIKHLIKELPEETIIYPGHGDPSSLGEEGKNLAQFF